MRTLVLATLLTLASLAAACTTYQDNLARGQKAFEENEYERALALLRNLEPDTSQLAPSERAQYAYLRGMTDYRIGYKLDARHWLAVAKALDDATPGMLPGDWKQRLGEALTELNESVYGSGIESLSNAKKAGDLKEEKPKKTKDEDEP